MVKYICSPSNLSYIFIWTLQLKLVLIEHLNSSFSMPIKPTLLTWQHACNSKESVMDQIIFSFPFIFSLSSQPFPPPNLCHLPITSITIWQKWSRQENKSPDSIIRTIKFVICFSLPLLLLAPNWSARQPTKSLAILFQLQKGSLVWVSDFAYIYVEFFPFGVLGQKSVTSIVKICNNVA